MKHKCKKAFTHRMICWTSNGLKIDHYITTTQLSVVGINSSGRHDLEIPKFLSGPISLILALQKLHSDDWSLTPWADFVRHHRERQDTSGNN